MPIFTVAVLLASLVLVPYANAGSYEPTDSPPVKAGGLVCFTLAPPPSKDQRLGPAASCDQRCAAQGAACTGMQSGGLNPATTCADPPNSLALCRCCRAAK